MRSLLPPYVALSGFFALGMLLACACDLAPSNGSGGAMDGGLACRQLPFAACDLATVVEMQPFDSARGCVAGPERVDGVCLSSAAGADCRSASLNVDCAISPDGGMYFTVVPGHAYVSGPGWRATYYPSYGPRPSSDAVASRDDEAKCYAAMCSPRCPGAAALPYSPCPDAGWPPEDAGARD